MQYNEFEGMLKSVTNASMFAERMNTCVDAVRSKGAVCRRDLIDKVPNPNYYMDILESHDLVIGEIRIEGTIKIKFERLLYNNKYFKIKINNDNTVSLTFWEGEEKTVKIYDCQIVYTNDNFVDIKGYIEVQVKRKYWIWNNNCVSDFDEE